LIGKTISHYKILEKLGEGGMGVVYKARDTKLDRDVALKFLPSHLAVSEQDKARFIQEAKAASAINHHNICTVYSIDEHEGQLFIAMEYVDGESLRNKINSATINPKYAIDIGIQIAVGLAAAHEKDIVHRDIKPENVMIRKDGIAQIMDFGLARRAGSVQLTKAGGTVGTIAYMSPEQARGEHVDHRTDIWALGVVLYEMLCGKLPFAGEYEQAIIYQIVNQDPLPLTQHQADLPTEIVRIVSTAMQKEPSLRFQTMSKLRDDLRSLTKQSEGGTMPQVSSDELRLAVLPLANISLDPNDQFFADGMTEELISRLSKIGRLRVIARTSVMQYKGTTKSVADISRELNVANVIEGSVRKAGDKVRIRIQLVDARSQEHLWSDDYDRDIKDIFAIQTDVAQRVARALEIQLIGDEKRLVENEATKNLDAYDLYLKGRYFLGKRTEEGLSKAIAYFQQATARDATYALAYAGTSDAYMVLALLEFLPPHEAFPKAKAAAARAIEIDPSMAEAHASLGVVKFQYDWDWAGAELEFKETLRLNPNYGNGHHYYADFLKALGRFDEALGEIRKAQQLDPLSLAINTGVGHVLYLSRRYDEAIDQYRKTLELDPNYLQARLWFGRPFLQKEMFEESIRELEAAVELSGGSTIATAMLGHARAASGNRTEALRMLDELMKRSKRQYVPSYWIGMIYVGLGDLDQAFAWFSKACEERSSWLAWMNVEPRFDVLRRDSRFPLLLKKMRFEQ
jgi:serine/threonine-protein kinase